MNAPTSTGDNYLVGARSVTEDKRGHTAEHAGTTRKPRKASWTTHHISSAMEHRMCCKVQRVSGTPPIYERHSGKPTSSAKLRNSETQKLRNSEECNAYRRDNTRALGALAGSTPRRHVVQSGSPCPSTSLRREWEAQNQGNPDHPIAT
ncbi:hypothetical protein PsAD2_04431 [Pseudovibrio axinellae]|uniref:Uncharacterized protein n=1 Tax=Pseudovibrio axinellae TaxID=989403 RepID=A0A165T2M4_9HYPH|nr:hypothetical protein PsAD2_04431 [Pseudovibrio axinellae]